MAKDIMEVVKKKMKDGWIKAWMAVEVLAVTKEAAESSLTKHIERMEKDESGIIYKKGFKEPTKVPNPFKKGEDAYSMVVEIELVARRFENLLFLVLNYAPSGVEILEPGEIKLELGEAQGVLNTISELIHKFAAASRGRVMIST
jgi:hypothetical protein